MFSFICNFVPQQKTVNNQPKTQRSFRLLLYKGLRPAGLRVVGAFYVPLAEQRAALLAKGRSRVELFD